MSYLPHPWYHKEAKGFSVRTIEPEGTDTGLEVRVNDENSTMCYNLTLEEVVNLSHKIKKWLKRPGVDARVKAMSKRKLDAHKKGQL